MNRFALCVLVFAAAGLAGAAWAGQDKPEPQLRLELDLIDGSRVIGVPSIESVPVQTSYAKMDIPLKQILTVRMGEDHETASFDLRNGDKLKGVVNLEPIKLETVFGKAVIGIEHIKEVRVVLSGGPLPDALRQGLVLYYSFDRDEGGKVTDESGKKNHGKVHGATWSTARSGNGAYEFDGKDDSIEVGPTDVFKTQGLLSGCAWVRRVSRDTIVLSNYRGGSAYPGQFSFLINGEGNLDLILGQGGPSEYLRYYGSIEPDLVPTGEWHHIAFSYEERRESGKKVQFFVDGKEVSKYLLCTDGRDGTGGPVLQTSDSLKIASHRDQGVGHSKGAVDEVMLWHRALTEREIVRICEIQK